MKRNVALIMLCIGIVSSLLGCGNTNNFDIEKYALKMEKAYKEWEQIRSVTTSDYSQQKEYDVACDTFFETFSELQSMNEEYGDQIDQSITWYNASKGSIWGERLSGDGYGDLSYDFELLERTSLSAIEIYDKKIENSYLAFERDSVQVSDMFLTMIHDINNALYDMDSSIYPIETMPMTINSVNELWTYIDCRYDWGYYDEIDSEMDGISNTSEGIYVDAIVSECEVLDNIIIIKLRFIDSTNFLTEKSFSWNVDTDNLIVLQSEYISVNDEFLYYENVKTLKPDDEVRVLLFLEEGKNVEDGEIRAMRINVESTTYYNDEYKEEIMSSESVVEEENNAPDERYVYIANSGSKYHGKNCRFLKDSCNKILYEDAKAKGYTPCGVCNPAP